MNEARQEFGFYTTEPLAWFNSIGIYAKRYNEKYTCELRREPNDAIGVSKFFIGSKCNRFVTFSICFNTGKVKVEGACEHWLSKEFVKINDLVSGKSKLQKPLRQSRYDANIRKHCAGPGITRTSRRNSVGSNRKKDGAYVFGSNVHSRFPSNHQNKCDNQSKQSLAKHGVFAVSEKKQSVFGPNENKNKQSARVVYGNRNGVLAANKNEHSARVANENKQGLFIAHENKLNFFVAHGNKQSARVATENKHDNKQDFFVENESNHDTCVGSDFFVANEIEYDTCVGNENRFESCVVDDDSKHGDGAPTKHNKQHTRKRSVCGNCKLKTCREVFPDKEVETCQNQSCAESEDSDSKTCFCSLASDTNKSKSEKDVLGLAKNVVNILSRTAVLESSLKKIEETVTYLSDKIHHNDITSGRKHSTVKKNIEDIEAKLVCDVTVFKDGVERMIEDYKHATHKHHEAELQGIKEDVYYFQKEIETQLEDEQQSKEMIRHQFLEFKKNILEEREKIEDVEDSIENVYSKVGTQVKMTETLERSLKTIESDVMENRIMQENMNYNMVSYVDQSERELKNDVTRFKEEIAKKIKQLLSRDIESFEKMMERAFEDEEVVHHATTKERSNAGNSHPIPPSVFDEEVVSKIKMLLHRDVDDFGQVMQRDRDESEWKRETKSEWSHPLFLNAFEEDGLVKNSKGGLPAVLVDQTPKQLVEQTPKHLLDQMSTPPLDTFKETYGSNLYRNSDTSINSGPAFYVSDINAQLVMCFDSNQKYINFQKLWIKTGTKIIPCMNWNEVNDITTTPFPNLDYFFTSVGVHDVDTHEGDEVFTKIIRVISTLKGLYPKIKMIVSEITPRMDALDTRVKAINTLLNQFCDRIDNVYIVSHSNLRNPLYFEDAKHIKRDYVPIFASNIKKTLFKAYSRINVKQASK